MEILKKPVIILLATVLALFVGVVLWMNLTPGYFQYGVCGYVGYYTSEEVEIMRNWQTRCRLPSEFERLKAQALIQLAKLDFNRGSVGSSAGKFCGGIARNLPENQCPSGYRCQLDGNHPDAGGHCVKSGLFGF